MKAWKFLSAPLMLMLLACLQGNASAADITDPVTAGFGGGQKQHVTIDGNVKVEGSSEAVYVKSDAPEEAEDKSASARINGDVSATNQGATTAVFADAWEGDACAYVTGNVSTKANCVTKGVYAYGHGYNRGRSGVVEVGGDVTAESLTYATGIDSDNGRVNVGGNVTAKTGDSGQSAYGVESYDDESITIGGNVKADSKYAMGVCAYTSEKTDIDIKGGVSATGKDVIGLQLEAYGDHEGPELGDGVGNDGNLTGCLSVTVGNGITATSTNTDEEFYGSSQAISFVNHGDKILADITGDVVARSPLGDAVGVATKHYENYTYEIGGPFSNGKSEILIHGNVISDGVGITFDTLGEDTDVNVLVENEIQAKKVGVELKRSDYAEEDLTTEPKLTVWKIQVNERGHVAEGTIVASHDEDIGAEGNSITDDTLAENFEKHIMYIIKVEQPGEGGTIKAVDKDGNDLLKSYDFDVAHEGDKVILKANLADGYKLVAAYNGDGEKTPLLQDENGNYYIIVPKGGGVYLSVELESTTDHNKSDNEDNTKSLDNETEVADDETTKNEKLSLAASNNAETKEVVYSDAVKTGDVINVAPWLLLSVVSAGGIIGLEKRSKKAEK